MIFLSTLSPTWERTRERGMSGIRGTTLTPVSSTGQALTLSSRFVLMLWHRTSYGTGIKGEGTSEKVRELMLNIFG